jgi:MerR family Zn(II)-responsive transcriptional regulator of zntA
MRIGELARRSGVPRTALRYYEQVGLLSPPERTESGYRSYSEEAIDRRHAEVRARIAELRGLERELRQLRARAASLEPRGTASRQASAT